jgi:hypothetical protein
LANDGNVKHKLLKSYLQAPVWCLDPNPEEINILQDIAVQCRALILLGLVCVSLAVSSAAFLSVSTPLVTVGFGRDKQLLGSDFPITMEKVAVGETRSSGKRAGQNAW